MEKTLELDSLKQLYEKYKEDAFKDFFTFLKFQSVSSEPEYKKDVLACADFVSTYLKNIGFEVETLETSGHPTIYAHYLKAGIGQPTLLIYNHYDVQPVDPLDLWMSPPFEPVIRQGEVFARGAQDNKGQCFYVLLALKVLMETTGTLPINIKLCIEGEEECGSSGLSEIAYQYKEKLKSDYVAVVDLGVESLEKPAITLGLRGLVTMDVEVSSTKTDLHSGSHGGIAFNPIHALVELLSSLRDKEGKITAHGFYDDIIPLSHETLKNVHFDFNEKKYEEDFGAEPTGGEKAFSPLERNWIRPTLEINGITGGYQGAGFKTVIPAKASAKVSCRLVPGQNPDKIGALIEKHLVTHAPKGVKVKVDIHKGTGFAVQAEARSKAAMAFANAYSEVFMKPCQFIYSGASIPVIPKLAEACGGDVVLVGLGLPGDCIHAPNEHFGENRIELGFLSIARALYLLKN